MDTRGLIGLDAIRTIFLIGTFYIIAMPFYRVFLSPLSKIPSPKLAALSYLYEFYWDGIQPGQLLFKTKELHEKCGTIARTGPYTVHINDISFYDNIYAGAGTKHPRDKVHHVLTAKSMFNTFESGLHRKRRAAISAPFSKQSIRTIEPAIWDIAQDYAGRLARLDGTGEVVELKGLWNMYALRDGRQEVEFLGLFDNWQWASAWSRMFPWFFDAIDALPLTVLKWLHPSWEKLQKFDAQITRQINEVLARDTPLVGAKNVFQEMRDSKHLPPSDKSEPYYKNEANSFIGAETETTASSLTTLSYHLLANPHMLQKLREELSTVMPDGRGEPPTVAELEALPYLTGVIQEGIRLAFGVAGRLPRAAPSEELVYHGYKLPPGTIISGSAYMIHTDERYFPNALAFDPERWERRSALAPYFLFDTSARDIEVVADAFIGLRPFDSKRVRVKVLGERM
ncbi:cytochrome P450 [Xylariaceae sp. FL1272]|nr:cytochrome P450 [Xylariaceae sp. FL1272]